MLAAPPTAPVPGTMKPEPGTVARVNVLPALSPADSTSQKASPSAGGLIGSVESMLFATPPPETA
jgi:hypothetical protein